VVIDRNLPHDERDRQTEAVLRPVRRKRDRARKPDVTKWAEFTGWDNFADQDPEELTSTFSERRIADYKPFSMVDGEGVRCSLYVSGCLFACPGCFNLAAQSFRYGEPYSRELENQIMADLAQPFVQGLSLLGGEPFQNPQVCLELVDRLREELPSKDVWAWTGYTFEWLRKRGSWSQLRLMEQVDVLVDGPFRQDLKDLTLPFRGSSNQRLIDVPESLRLGKAVLWRAESHG